MFRVTGIVKSQCFWLNETFILAIVDSEDKVVAGILRDNGKFYILPTNEGYNKSISLIKSFLYVLCDKENKILETIDIDGLHIFYSGIKAFGIISLPSFSLLINASAPTILSVFISNFGCKKILNSPNFVEITKL